MKTVQISAWHSASGVAQPRTSLYVIFPALQRRVSSPKLFARARHSKPGHQGCVGIYHFVIHTKVVVYLIGMRKPSCLSTSIQFFGHFHALSTNQPNLSDSGTVRTLIFFAGADFCYVLLHYRLNYYL